MPWKDLETADPPLAAFGRERLHGRVAYLATSRANGAPRVHPVTPIIGDGRCFLFMEPTSPKGRDLERDARFALHCAVSDDTGGSGEFALAGIARRETSAETRGLAAGLASYAPEERYILFELHPRSALATVYGNGRPERREWRATAP